MMDRRSALLLLALLPALAAGRAEAGPASGTITGVVFHDVDGNGVRDPDEPGLAYRPVTLTQEGEERYTSGTAVDGTYRIDGVAAGEYDVIGTVDDPQGLCVDGVFSFYPLSGSFCVGVTLPWNGTTPESVPISVSGGSTIDANFGAEPADAAVIAGRVALEADRAPPGTVIEALVNGIECGSTAVLPESSELDYVLTIFGAQERAGCATLGDRVQFRVEGLLADETFGWQPFTDVESFGQFQYQSLSAMDEHAWYWMGSPDAGLPPAGTSIEAVIDGVVCGETTLETAGHLHTFAYPDQSAGFSRLIVPSEALQAGCGRPGATVSFLMGGVQSDVTVPWQPGLQRIDLTLAAQQPTLTPTISPPDRLPSAGDPTQGERANRIVLPAAVLLGAAFLLLSGAGLLVLGRRR